MQRVAVKLVVVALLIASGSSAWARQKPATAQSFERTAADAEKARNENRIEDAIQLYHSGVLLKPEWAEGWWYLGTLLYEQDAFGDAVIAFDKAANLSPEIGTSWVMLGLCEFQLQRFDDALKHIQRGRKLGDSANSQLTQVAIYHEGILLLGKGDFEKAQETLGELSSAGVENENLTSALGLSVLRIRFSDLTSADTAMRELVRRTGWAEHLTAQKRFDEATTEYAKLAADYPKSSGVQFAYGRFLLRSNQDEMAVEAFKREIENTPNHLMARVGIADVKFRLKDFDGALPYAEEVAKLAPQLPQGHYLLGAILLGGGRTERAIAELETAQKAMPDEPKVYFQLARAYTQANRREDAARARASFARLNKAQEDATGGQPGPAPR